MFYEWRNVVIIVFRFLVPTFISLPYDYIIALLLNLTLYLRLWLIKISFEVFKLLDN